MCVCVVVRVCVCVCVCVCVLSLTPQKPRGEEVVVSYANSVGDRCLYERSSCITDNLRSTVYFSALCVFPALLASLPFPCMHSILCSGI